DNGQARPDWPAADHLGDAAPDAAPDAVPWDRPAAEQGAQWQDPDDALAPVVGDVAGPVAWASWNGADNGHANGNGNGFANGNGKLSNSNSVGGGNGIRYASAQTPEPMSVTAHS